MGFCHKLQFCMCKEGWQTLPKSSLSRTHKGPKVLRELPPFVIQIWPAFVQTPLKYSVLLGSLIVSPDVGYAFPKIQINQRKTALLVWP